MSKSSLTIAVQSKRWLDYLANHGRSERTTWTYGHSLRWFGEWLEGRRIRLEAVERATIEDWISAMRADGRHPKTMSCRVRVVCGFFAWLTAEDLIRRDPLFGLAPIKVPRPLPQALTRAEVFEFLGAARTPRERAIAHLLYSSGCRRSELLNMKLSNVDFDHRLILVQGKGSKERVVLFDGQTLEALRYWLRARAKIAKKWTGPDEGFLFVGRQGKLGGQRLLDIVHAIAERAGIGRRVFVHAFRHTFATHSLDSGMRIEELKELLGHESIATTSIYARVSLERLRESYDRAHPRAAAGS